MLWLNGPKLRRPCLQNERATPPLGVRSSAGLGWRKIIAGFKHTPHSLLDFRCMG